MLGGYDAVEIDDSIAGFNDLLVGQLQHLGGVTSLILRGCIREQLTNIRQARRSQQGIRHRMQQDVGITVSNSAPVVSNFHTAQSQGASLG